MNDGVGTAEPEFAEMRALSAAAARSRIRDGVWRGHTAGIGLGCLQGNLVILDRTLALDFFRFCQRNPKPCPLVGVSDTGDPTMRTLGADIDIRTDIPLYNVYRRGELAEQTPDIAAYWTPDSVAFVIGCSFTFEEALLAEGVPLRHVEQNRTVPMYRSGIATVPAGPFHGPLVVSMRPMLPDQAIRAIAITARFPHAHGTPVHVGDPTAIGIADIGRPDWGEAVDIRPGEVPVFWACGVTPQAVAMAVKPELCITHAPGRMLITDVPCWRQGEG